MKPIPRQSLNHNTGFSWLWGRLDGGSAADLCCSWCGKWVGFALHGARRIDRTAMQSRHWWAGEHGPGIMDAMELVEGAGWVMDRQEPVPEVFKRCTWAALSEPTNPIACSDECEAEILAHPMWAPCAPPFGYRQFSAGLVER